MNGNDLLLDLKIQINKLDTGSNKTLYPEVGLAYLNDAYLSLVKAKYAMDNQSGTGMSKGQKSEDELMHLIAEYNISLTTDSSNEIRIASDLVEDYLYYLDTDKLTCDGVAVLEVREKPAGRSSVARQDPFNKPTKLYPILQQLDNSLVYTFGNEGAEIEGVLLYLKSPKEITLAEETECPFCDEIVNTAAIEILENWEDQRYASKAQLDQAINNH